MINHYYDAIVGGGVVADLFDVSRPEVVKKFDQRQLSADSFKKFNAITNSIGTISMLPELRELPMGTIIVQPEACHRLISLMTTIAACYFVASY